MPDQSPLAQIHQQESQVVQDVDAGDQVAELDAVEQGWLSLDEADVGEMEIAVAATHATRGATAIQQRSMRLKRRLGCVA